MAEDKGVIGELFWRINEPKDKNIMDDLEKKHTPVLEFPEKVKRGEAFELGVNVGHAQHPMQNAHFIQFVDLFVDGLYLTRVNFTPVVMEPKAKISVVLSAGKEISAVLRCNLHGLWKASYPVRVE
jgi:superoxide reductase